MSIHKNNNNKAYNIGFVSSYSGQNRIKCTHAIIQLTQLTTCALKSIAFAWLSPLPARVSSSSSLSSSHNRMVCLVRPFHAIT